jgi:hypothetical protein
LNEGRARSRSRCREVLLLRPRSAELRGRNGGHALQSQTAADRSPYLAIWRTPRLRLHRDGIRRISSRLARVEEATNLTMYGHLHRQSTATGTRFITPSNDNYALRHEGRLSNGTENHNTPVGSSDNQTTKSIDEEVAVAGGGNFTGLASMAVAHVNSTIASPE